MTVERLMDILKESKYTVVLSGNGMVLESDYMLIRDSQESYDIEKKYRYSAEELFSSSLFSTRKELFYEFYRNEMLPQLEKPPGEGFYALAALEKKGLIDTVITRRVYHLPTRAGCKNVIELHGNICEHYCPHCGEEYSLDYIRQSRRVPLCTKCKYSTSSEGGSLWRDGRQSSHDKSGRRGDASRCCSCNLERI